MYSSSTNDKKVVLVLEVQSAVMTLPISIQSAKDHLLIGGPTSVSEYSRHITLSHQKT